MNFLLNYKNNINIIFNRYLKKNMIDPLKPPENVRGMVILDKEKFK